MSDRAPRGESVVAAGITLVRTADEAADVAEMVWEFFEFLRGRYPERRASIDTYLQVQDVAGELARLTERFTPPHGECLLARLDGRPVGTLMLKRVTAKLCEMNRMYVRPSARGARRRGGACPVRAALRCSPRNGVRRDAARSRRPPYRGAAALSLAWLSARPRSDRLCQIRTGGRGAPDQALTKPHSRLAFLTSLIWKHCPQRKGEMPKSQL